MGKPRMRTTVDYFGDEIEISSSKPQTGWIPLIGDKGRVIGLRINRESGAALVDALQYFLNRTSSSDGQD